MHIPYIEVTGARGKQHFVYANLLICYVGLRCCSANKLKCPGAPLTNFNDGEVQQGFIFYTQKNHNFRICLPKKKSLPFLAYPKKSLSPFFATPKNPSVFFATQKHPGIFHRPKKSPWAKISDPKKSLPPYPPSLNHVSEVPGLKCLKKIPLHYNFHLYQSDTTPGFYKNNNFIFKFTQSPVQYSYWYIWLLLIDLWNTLENYSKV